MFVYVNEQEQTGFIAIFNWICARCGAAVKPVTFRYAINTAMAPAAEQISITKRTRKQVRVGHVLHLRRYFVNNLKREQTVQTHVVNDEESLKNQQGKSRVENENNLGCALVPPLSDCQFIVTINYPITPKKAQNNLRL